MLRRVRGPNVRAAGLFLRALLLVQPREGKSYSARTLAPASTTMAEQCTFGVVALMIIDP